MQDVKLASSWGVELLEMLNKMQKQDQMCDLHLVLKDGIVINVHSCVIAAASPFLKSLLVNTQIPEINMEDFPVEVIKQIIEFIYTGEVTVQGEHLVMLHSVAVSLNIPLLASVAQKLIHDNNLATKSPSFTCDQSEDIPLELTSEESTFIKDTALPKRKPGRPRKQTSSSKQLLDETKPNEVNVINQTPESTVLSPCLQNQTISSQVLSELPNEEINSNTDIIQSDLKKKCSLAEQLKDRHMSEGNNDTEQAISDIHGGIVYITEPEETTPQTLPLPNTVSVKLEKDDDNNEMIVDSIMRNDYQTTDQQEDSISVSANKTVLSTVVNTVDVNSVVPEGLRHDVTSVSRPRRKTAQGAALAAKVPVHVGPTFTCTACERSFTNEDMYNRHCSRHRSNNASVKRFTCQYCEFSTMYKAALDEHVHVHTGEKPYACNECDKAFKHKKSLQIHMWIHAGKKFPCPLCGKEMSTAQYMRRHMSNVHSDYRPYKCSTCSRCFNRLESLKKHMDTHNDIPKYECVVCNQRFLTQIALKNHMTNKHKERRRYCCLKCGNEFINLHKIKSHRCQPPDDGKKRRRIRDVTEDTDVKPVASQLDLPRSQDGELSDTTHVEPQPGEDLSLQSNPETLLPDHVYTPKKEEASQVMIVSNTTVEEEFEDTDGETSSEDEDEELLSMDLDEPEDG